MWNKLRVELSGSRLELVGLNVSLIDIIWTEGRNPKRSKDAFILGVEYAGTFLESVQFLKCNSVNFEYKYWHKPFETKHLVKLCYPSFYKEILKYV